MAGIKAHNVNINDIINLINTNYASFLDIEIFDSFVSEFNLGEGQVQFRYREYLKTYINSHTISRFG